MGKFARHQPRGNVTREVQRVAKRTKLEGTARSLAASTLGDGGEFSIEGDMTVSSPGRFIARYPSGQISTVLGPLRAAANLDDLIGDGLLVQRDDPTGVQPDIAQIAQYADGSARSYFGFNGTPLTPIDIFSVRSSLIYLRAQGSQAVAGAATGLHLLSDDNTVYISHATSGGSANAILDPTTGLVTRVSSSQRYKTDVQPLDVDLDAYLELEPVTFVDKSAAERYEAGEGPEPRRYVGFIAEALDAAGLDAFVEYVREESADGPGVEALPGERVESITYDRLIAPAIQVMRQQRDRLDAQDALIADLSARLEALEAKDG